MGNSLIRSPLTVNLYSDENEDEDERLKAAEQRLIATGSQVNVASPRLNAAEQQVNCDDSQVKSCVAAVKGDGLKDTQSQGDDSPATPLRLTSSTAAKLLTAHPLTAHRYNGVWLLAIHKHCKEGKHSINLCRMLIFFIISHTDDTESTEIYFSTQSYTISPDRE